MKMDKHDYIAKDMQRFAKHLNDRIAQVINEEFSKNDLTFLKGYYYIITFENPDKTTSKNETVALTNCDYKTKKDLNIIIFETAKRFKGNPPGSIKLGEEDL